MRSENRKFSESGFIVLLNLLAVGTVSDEVGVAVAGGEDKEKG